MKQLRWAKNKIYIVFAILAIKWEIEEELGSVEEKGTRKKEAETGEVVQLFPRRRTVNMKECAQWKAQFRSEAMKLFEADYPQQLVTEMRRTERRK